MPGEAGEVDAGDQGFRMLGAQYPLADGQQRGEPVAGAGRIPRLAGVEGEVGAGGQGGRVLGAEHPLLNGQQRGVLVAAGINS
jgi:hypothetical protein